MKSKKICIALSMLCLSSCSTLKKTIVYSSLSGGIAGAAAGYTLSPNKESQGVNAAIFGLVGAGVAALTGYVFYKDDPRNQKLNHMLEESDRLGPNTLGLDLNDLKIEANLTQSETYKTPDKKLPKELQGKIKKQYIIKHQSKERYVNKGNKTFYIPSFQIYEHAYDNINAAGSEGGIDE
jgi:hypothetical protein